MANSNPEKNIEQLWLELESIEPIDERRISVFKDTKKKKPKYKKLADADVYRFFEILGGNEIDVEQTHNWAFEYNYEDFISDNGLEYSKKDAKKWDLKEESIENAHATGHWYVTGLCEITLQEGIVLPFEFDYCEGYLDTIIGHPYNTEEGGNSHGILFF